MVTVLTNKEVTTRKPHKCFMCLRKFPEKTRMHVQNNVCDREIYSIYSCMTCEELKSLIDLTDGEHAYQEGCVYEEVYERGYDKKEYSPEMLLSDLKEERCLNLEKTRLSP